jgi:cell division protein FtsI/penicillin-binding protein 2
MIGQGRILNSPLGMALVAAAVDSGSWHPPTLITDPSTPQPSQPHTLPSAAVDELRTLVRAVVTSGTGTPANLPGQPVFGKTGTAEYGSANPPSTDAWFIGFRGDIAFAVIVQGGGVGGQVAAPIAARFLQPAS